MERPQSAPARPLQDKSQKNPKIQTRKLRKRPFLSAQKKREREGGPVKMQDAGYRLLRGPPPPPKKKKKKRKKNNNPDAGGTRVDAETQMPGRGRGQIRSSRASPPKPQSNKRSQKSVQEYQKKNTHTSSTPYKTVLPRASRQSPSSAEGVDGSALEYESRWRRRCR
jgi:hypothetical protein